MDIYIDFLHVINPFCYLFHLLSVTLLAMFPQRKTKNLLKNHLTTLAKSNDRFGLNLPYLPIGIYTTNKDSYNALPNWSIFSEQFYALQTIVNAIHSQYTPRRIKSA